MQVTVESEPWDGVDGVRLRAAQRAELDARYGNDDHEPGAAPTAGDIDVFLVARDAHGVAVGCGGLRPLGPDSAEIKRMYVEPAVRGTGVAVGILRALEHEARDRGVVNLLLETGTAQPEAMRFYEREGYDRIDNYGPYEGEALSVCYARRLR
ncbi:GNAT family N-acetyltransferase [Micromonospora sp. NPDC050187]|uniref:GNAT family N-acetyltransferase n=1 Tax=Micromonospora sp. NPDC050187 TaxID=3364277 RepID=UPI003791C8F8